MAQFNIIDGVIYGNQDFMIPSHMNCGKYIIDRMIKGREKIALINGLTGEKITFRDMVQRIVNTATSLIRLGVKRDEVVAICSENRVEFLIAVIAVWCSGAAVTLLNAGYCNNEIIHTINISKPKYIFLSPTTYEKYYETIVNSKIVEKFFVYGNSISDHGVTTFDELSKEHVNIESFRPPTDYNGLARTALIQYSSGTTGLPKGAKSTHLNIITVGNQPYNTSAKDLRCLSITPWSNPIGIVCTLDELVNNRTVIHLPRFKEEQYLKCIEEYKAGMLLVVPPLIVILAKSSIIENYDVSSVEVMFCGGACLDLSIMAEARRRFPNLLQILQIYGMTESSGAITEETRDHFKPGSVGRVTLGNIIKVVDVKTRKTLGPLQQGEFCIKGPTLFSGYIGKNLNDDLDEDGFFKTGDVGYYDEDGYFYYLDRIKELIKYKASQVSPSELEAILIRHPAVKDAGVIGKPDSLAGELPTAFVVKKLNADVTPQELIDYVASNVSPWKQLRGGIYFVEEIPKVSSGKILRRKLRELLKEPTSTII